MKHFHHIKCDTIFSVHVSEALINLPAKTVPSVKHLEDNREEEEKSVKLLVRTATSSNSRFFFFSFRVMASLRSDFFCTGSRWTVLQMSNHLGVFLDSHFTPVSMATKSCSSLNNMLPLFDLSDDRPDSTII
ncbi:hypothetical protein CEXT_549571 [Caerostris extrusa]|uniref:Uncharacterized protein n=1 Tax=Caerostris extrusa TaxID=172846 RepID=A0AAV4N5F1_CAEEX|nr:hypothetical protein CEXT_549571 [Caerostris extrusa]